MNNKKRKIIGALCALAFLLIIIVLLYYYEPRKIVVRNAYKSICPNGEFGGSIFPEHFEYYDTTSDIEKMYEEETSREEFWSLLGKHIIRIGISKDKHYIDVEWWADGTTEEQEEMERLFDLYWGEYKEYFVHYHYEMKGLKEWLGIKQATSL